MALQCLARLAPLLIRYGCPPNMLFRASSSSSSRFSSSPLAASNWNDYWRFFSGDTWMKAAKPLIRQVPIQFFSLVLELDPTALVVSSSRFDFRIFSHICFARVFFCGLPISQGHEAEAVNLWLLSMVDVDCHTPIAWKYFAGLCSCSRRFVAQLPFLHSLLQDSELDPFLASADALRTNRSLLMRTLVRLISRAALASLSHPAGSLHSSSPQTRQVAIAPASLLFAFVFLKRFVCRSVLPHWPNTLLRFALSFEESANACARRSQCAKFLALFAGSCCVS